MCIERERYYIYIYRERENLSVSISLSICMSIYVYLYWWGLHRRENPRVFEVSRVFSPLKPSLGLAAALARRPAGPESYITMIGITIITIISTTPITINSIITVIIITANFQTKNL